MSNIISYPYPSISIKKQLRGPLKHLTLTNKNAQRQPHPTPPTTRLWSLRGSLSGYQSSIFKDHSLRQGRMDFCPQALGFSSPAKPQKVNVLCQDVISVQGLSGEGRLVCGFWLGSMSNQFNEYITDIVKRIRKICRHVLIEIKV